MLLTHLFDSHLQVVKILGKEKTHSTIIFEKVLKVNLTGTFNVIKYSANQMQNNPFILLDTFKLYIDIADKELKALLKRVDLFCINFNEARAISGIDGSNLRDMAKSILDLGPKSLIIKDGENGSHFFDSQNNFSIKAFPVESVIDTTGAGDAYIGGVLMGKMNEKNIFESMKMGAVTASFCIEGVGMDGLLKINDIEFIKRLEWMNVNHTT